MAKSLGASRPTVREYVSIAQSHGYGPGQPPPAQGWKAFLEEVAPEVFDPAAQSKVFAELRSHRVCIEEMLADTSLLTAWQRLRDEQGLTASYSSFRRYVQRHLPGLLERPHITVRREDPPLGEEAQIDFGYLGLWNDQASGQRCRLWAFVMVLSNSRHMFACAVRHNHANGMEAQ